MVTNGVRQAQFKTTLSWVVLGMETHVRSTKQSINHTINPRDIGLHGSTRLPMSTGDSSHSLLLEIPIRVQALNVSLVLSQFHHKYNAFTAQYKYMKP